MLEDFLYSQPPRKKRRFELRDVVGVVICSLAVTYLLTAGVLGLLAR